MTGFAYIRGAELLVSIDHRAEHLRTVVAQLPRYPFLHPRFIDADELSDTGSDIDIAYVAYPSMLGVRIDIILRMECAMLRRILLEPDGIVVFHDWNTGDMNRSGNFFRYWKADHRSPARLGVSLRQSKFATAGRRIRSVRDCEPHIIIRDGCPDLFAMVPEDRLGPMMDGHWTDRASGASS